MGDYSSGDVAALPGTSANLDHVYDATDLSNVGTNDTNYVNQTGSSGFELHQYKDSITATSASVTWIGKSSLAPSSSKVQLQVYKVAAPAGWQDVSGAGASNNVAAADTDFTLSGTVATADYLDSGVITFRVYQSAVVGETLIDSYSESNQDNWWVVPNNYLAISQSFTSNGYNITKVKFFLKGASGVTGNIYAKIYDSTGVLGSKVPTGVALGTSDAVNPATIGTGAFELVTFTFSTPVSTVNTTIYCVVLDGSGITAEYISMGNDLSGTAAGNDAFYDTDHWTNWERDEIFYVYGVAP